MFLADFLRQAAKGKLVEGEVVQVKKLVEANRGALRLLAKASQAREITWGLDFSKPFWTIEIPPIFFLDRLARLQACEAILLARSGNAQEAANKLRTGFWLGQAAAASQHLLGAHVAVSINNIILDAAQFVLARIPHQVARKTWEPYLRPDEAPSGIKEHLVFEFFASADDLMKLGWLGWIQTPLLTRGALGEILLASVYGPFLGVDVAATYRHFIRSLPCLTLPYPQIEPCWSKARKEFMKKGWLFGQIGVPAFPDAYTRGLVSQAQFRLALLALALRESKQKPGAWPQDLDQLEAAGVEKSVLQDPFSEGKLRLKKEGQNLLMYSIGPDGVDDQAADYDPSTKKGDIVWRF